MSKDQITDYWSDLLPATLFNKLSFKELELLKRAALKMYDKGELNGTIDAARAEKLIDDFNFDQNEF